MVALGRPGRGPGSGAPEAGKIPGGRSSLAGSVGTTRGRAPSKLPRRSCALGSDRRSSCPTGSAVFPQSVRCLRVLTLGYSDLAPLQVRLRVRRVPSAGRASVRVGGPVTLRLSALANFNLSFSGPE